MSLLDCLQTLQTRFPLCDKSHLSQTYPFSNQTSFVLLLQLGLLTPLSQDSLSDSSNDNFPHDKSSIGFAFRHSEHSSASGLEHFFSYQIWTQTSSHRNPQTTSLQVLPFLHTLPPDHPKWAHNTARLNMHSLLLSPRTCCRSLQTRTFFPSQTADRYSASASFSFIPFPGSSKAGSLNRKTIFTGPVTGVFGRGLPRARARAARARRGPAG
jgi:hypothetical protein